MERNFNNLKRWMTPLLEKKDMSVESVARAAGVGRATIYHWFSDYARPSEEVMASVCHALGVPLEEGLRQYTPYPTGRPKGLTTGPRPLRAR